MTTEEKLQFNRMHATLHRIANDYSTSEELREESEEDFGLEFEEAIEMAYDNIQTDALFAIQGVNHIV